MKKSKQTKKPDSDGIKSVKLPLIKNNAQKGNKKEAKGNSYQKNELKDIPQIPNIPLTKRNPGNEKSLESINNKKKAGRISNLKNSKNNYTNKNYQEEVVITKNTEESSPKFTEEKLSKLKQQRKKRIKQEREEEKKQIEMYEKTIEEYKNSSKNKDNDKNIKSGDDPKIIISSKKAQKILENGGMLDAYKYVLSQLCKNGLPKGNIYEYASYVVKNYEKKWIVKKSKMTKDRIDKYYEEKQKEINKSLESDGEVKIVNKSLEHRNELKFIQNLDKSRSGRNVVPIPKTSTSPITDRFYYYPQSNTISNKSLKKDKIKKTTFNEKNNIYPIKLKDSSIETNNRKKNK